MKAVLIFLLYLTKCSASHVYWDDYDGSIPPEAVLGGTDEDGYDTYIGLIGAMDEETIDTPDMISATIYRNDSYGYISYRTKLYKSNKGVKIMCTTQPDKLHWLEALAPGCTLVRGTYQNPYTNRYIGRTSYNEQIVTGRFSLVENILLVPQRDMPDSQLEFKSYKQLMYCE